MKSVKLNLGCGAVRPINWINTDGSLNAQLQKIPILGKYIATKILKTVIYPNQNVVYMNLNKPWSFKNGEVDIVYASHLFEHLSRTAAMLFLSESFRTLKKDGVLRISVPDLYLLSVKYINDFNANDKLASRNFLWAINLDRENMYPPKRMNLLNALLAKWQSYPHQHKYMYDSISLTDLFTHFGFKNIRIQSYGKSEYISEINEVEGDVEQYLSLYIEAKK